MSCSLACLEASINGRHDLSKGKFHKSRKGDTKTENDEVSSDRSLVLCVTCREALENSWLFLELDDVLMFRIIATWMSFELCVVASRNSACPHNEHAIHVESCSGAVCNPFDCTPVTSKPDGCCLFWREFLLCFEKVILKHATSSLS